MITQTIDFEYYHKNLIKLLKKVQDEKITYVVMMDSKPVFEVKPISEIEEEEPTVEDMEAIKKYELLKNKEFEKVDLNNIKSEEDFIQFLKS